MLRTDSPGKCGRAPSLCLVAPSGPGLDASIRRHVMRVARTLGLTGWNVHVLWCGAGDDSMRTEACAACRRVGADCSFLDDFAVPRSWTLDAPYLDAALHNADRVRLALEQLHDQRGFDLIEIPERGGLGFRAVQAKQTGQAFLDVPLLATLHGPGVVLRQERGQWLSRPEELALDHAEQYSFEHADGQQLVWPNLTTRMPSFGWNIGADAVVVALDPDELVDRYHHWLIASGSTSPGQASPLVTVSVAYFNLGDYLEEALQGLARQAYANLEVLVINDGSTDAHAVDVFRRMKAVFPHFRFLDQANQGIGATRNRGLTEARGQYFLPQDADNIAHPDMVRRLVQGMERNPGIAALTCYFLAFREPHDLPEQRFAYAFKPTGGPRLLGCMQNVYGDGNALFRTDVLRAVGGFATERDTSFEDWELFVKMVNSGRRVDVLPDFLFYYRHRDQGFSRTTNGYANHQRVLRRYAEIESLPLHERRLLWTLLVGCQQRADGLSVENAGLLNRARQRWAARLKALAQLAFTGRRRERSITSAAP